MPLPPPLTTAIRLNEYIETGPSFSLIRGYASSPPLERIGLLGFRGTDGLPFRWNDRLGISLSSHSAGSVSSDISFSLHEKEAATPYDFPFWDDILPMSHDSTGKAKSRLTNTGNHGGFWLGVPIINGYFCIFWDFFGHGILDGVFFC